MVWDKIILVDKFPHVMKQLILTNSVPNIAKECSYGQKMRLPPTKISLPVKNNVGKTFVLLVTQFNEQNVRKLF
jgi:hypothetical protein